MLTISITKNDNKEYKYKISNQNMQCSLDISPNTNYQNMDFTDISTNLVLFSTVYLSHKLQCIVSYSNLYEIHYLGVISLLCPVSLLSSNVVS